MRPPFDKPRASKTLAASLLLALCGAVILEFICLQFILGGPEPPPKSGIPCKVDVDWISYDGKDSENLQGPSDCVLEAFNGRSGLGFAQVPLEAFDFVHLSTTDGWPPDFDGAKEGWFKVSAVVDADESKLGPVDARTIWVIPGRRHVTVEFLLPNPPPSFAALMAPELAGAESFPCTADGVRALASRFTPELKPR